MLVRYSPPPTAGGGRALSTVTAWPGRGHGGGTAAKQQVLRSGSVSSGPTRRAVRVRAESGKNEGLPAANDKDLPPAPQAQAQVAKDPPAASPVTLSEEDRAAFEAMSYPERLEVEVEPIAEALGYDTRDGLFGFTPFSELWTGRLAMAGFVVGVIQEQLTGDTILQQVGLNNQCKECLATALIGVLAGATLIAALSTVVRARPTRRDMSTYPTKRLRGRGTDAPFPTVDAVGPSDRLGAVGEFALRLREQYRAQTGSMTVSEWRRYAKFFGVDTEEQAAAVALQQKEKGLAKLLTVPDEKELSRSALTKNENILWSVLRVLGYFLLKEEVGPSSGAEAASVKSTAEMLRLSELQVGRIAMLGFTSAVVAEAILGVGVREQLELYSTLLVTGESLEAISTDLI